MAGALAGWTVSVVVTPLEHLKGWPRLWRVKKVRLYCVVKTWYSISNSKIADADSRTKIIHWTYRLCYASVSYFLPSFHDISFSDSYPTASVRMGFWACGVVSLVQSSSELGLGFCEFYLAVRLKDEADYFLNK